MEEHVLSVNKNEIDGEQGFNGDFFDLEDNHESSKDETTWF